MAIVCWAEGIQGIWAGDQMIIVSPVVGLVSNLLILVAVLLIWRKLGPYLERLSADYGVERFYRWCVGAMPVLITIGIIYSVVGFVLELAMKAIVK